MFTSMMLEVDPSLYNSDALSMSQKLEIGGQMLLLGMATVFAVLATIWLVLKIFNIVFAGTPKQALTEKEKVVPAPKAPKKPTPAPAPAVQDDAALIAAITAAISAYRASEGVTETVGFRVVSFKRK